MQASHKFFGHGITTTALQLTKAYAIISNGGYLVKPTLIKQENFDKSKNDKILNEGISSQVNSTLRKLFHLKKALLVLQMFQVTTLEEKQEQLKKL